MKKIISTLAGILMLTPVSAFALMHQYSCGDFNSHPGVSCTDDGDGFAVVTWSGADEAVADSLSHNLTGINPFYFTALAEGTGNMNVAGSCSGVDGEYNEFSGTVNDMTVTVNSGTGVCGIWINTNGGTSFTGTLSKICVSDTPGQCPNVSPPPPPPPPPIGDCTSVQCWIDSASASFDETTGDPTPAQLTDWTAHNFTLVFVGYGFALLYTLRFWIMAFTILSAVAYFAFRGMQYFRR